MRPIWLFAAVAVAGSALTGLLAASLLSRGGLSDELAACAAGGVAGGALGGPFELVDTTGATRTDADVFQSPSVLYFGYTFCPDICPFDTARNADAVRLLAERGVPAQSVFVSVDPARDTPEAMAEFVATIDPAIVGLTGSEAQVDAAKQAWRVYGQAQPAEDEFYLVDHSTLSYLVLPGIGFVDVVQRDETPEAVADRLQCFIEATS